MEIKVGSFVTCKEGYSAPATGIFRVSSISQCGHWAWVSSEMRLFGFSVEVAQLELHTPESSGSKMNRRGITSTLRKEGYSVELVYDRSGYWYFVFDDGKRFETETVGGVYRLGQLTTEQWLQYGREFAQRIITLKGGVI